METLVYIKFVPSGQLNYLKKFIDTGIIDIILNNTLISISYIDNRNGDIHKKLIPFTDIDFINNYVDDTGNKVYIYKISDHNIILVNGIFNNKIITNAIVTDETTYYVPSDVIIIEENIS